MMLGLFFKQELFASISMLYARGVSGAGNLVLQLLWYTAWALLLWSTAWALLLWSTAFLQRNYALRNFCEVSRFKRFDIKPTCRNWTKQDKFVMISEVWNPFVENCTSYYKPGQNITINKQLFPSNTLTLHLLSL